MSDIRFLYRSEFGVGCTADRTELGCISKPYSTILSLAMFKMLAQVMLVIFLSKAVVVVVIKQNIQKQLAQPNLPLNHSHAANQAFDKPMLVIAAYVDLSVCISEDCCRHTTISVSASA